MADATAPQPIPQPDPWAALTKFFGDTSAGRANGRYSQALLNNQRDQLANQQFATTSNNALNGAKFALDAPNTRASQSVRGDVMANAQDAEVSGLPDYVHVGKVSGGLRPSLFSDNTRQVGQGLSRNALLAQMNGGDKVDYPTAPTLTPVPEASALDTGLNIGAGASGAISALKSLFGGNGGPGAGGDIKKAYDAIKGLFSHPSNGNVGGDSSSFGGLQPTQRADGSYDNSDLDPSLFPDVPPTGTVNTDQFSGSLPDYGGTQGGIDGTDVPGGSDPMAEYLAWLASQGDGGGGGSETPFGMEPSATWGG